ncbi:MAG: hypothetical protein HY905_04605 [Deltaproteobacteria bacterium]|nr:hypothetical protein [Deltaproteobacteria bacterium]
MGAVEAGAAWRTGKADVASVVDAPDPFSPATADGRGDEVEFASSGAALLPNAKKKVEYAVAVYHVVSRDGVAVWRQAALVPLSFPAGARPGTAAPVANATTWNGRDDGGAIVPDGTYDVRVIYALLGRKTSGATVPWPTGDALAQGFVDTVLGGGPSGDDGGVFSGYGADGVKLFGFDDGATDVTVDDGPPVIQLRRPMDGDVILFSPVSVVGRVVDASGVAHVWVNGLEVPAPEGRFQTNVDLEPGINVIDILAEDAAGNRSSLSLTVRFAPDTTGPEIVIEYPLPGDELLETPVDVIGTVFDPSGVTAVFVNAVGAEVVGGEFFATAELRPGPNTIVVTAHDGWDNLSEVSVVVNLAETAPPPSPADGSVHGTVFDDATGAPLAGARVTCAELGVWAVAASDGTFTLAVPSVDTPPPVPLDADSSRQLLVDVRADGYLNAVRTVVVPEHPRGYEVAVDPVYLARQDPHVSVIGPGGGVATNGDGTVVVEFPPGALDRLVEFRLTSYPSARSTVAPLPPRMVAIYPVDFYPDGLELGQPIVDHLANTDGLAPGTELRCIRFQDGRWVEGGSARISDDGAWLDYETWHTSSHLPATTVSDPLPPVVQPDDGCTGADCAGACDDREQGQSSVSRRSGELQESIVVGPAGRENGDGLSPWPLRLQYSSTTVRPHALLEVRAWFPPDVWGWDRLKSMFRVDVLGSGRTFELEYTPAASGLAGPPGRLRYLFDGRRSSGQLGVSLIPNCGGVECAGTNAVHELLHELVYGFEEQAVRNATQHWVLALGLGFRCGS